MSAIDGATVSRKELAGVLGMTPANVSHLVRAGVLSVNTDATYPFGPNVRAWIAHREGKAKEAGERAAKRDALDRARLRRMEREDEEADAELIAMGEALSCLDMIAAAFLETIDRLPTRIAPPLGFDRTRVASIMGEMHGQLSARFGAIRRELVTGEVGDRA